MIIMMESMYFMFGQMPKKTTYVAPLCHYKPTTTPAQVILDSSCVASPHVYACIYCCCFFCFGAAMLQPKKDTRKPNTANDPPVSHNFVRM